MKIKRINRKIFPIFIMLIIGWMNLYYINHLDSIVDNELWNMKMTWLILGNIVSDIIIMKFADMRIVSFSALFIVVSYCFNCGQALLNYLSYKLFWHNDILNLYGDVVYRKSILVAFVSIYFVFWGMVLINYLDSKWSIKFRPGKYSFLPYDNNEELLFNKKLTLCLLLFGLPASLYIVSSQVYLTIQYGYAVSAGNKIHPIITILSKLVSAGVILLIYQAPYKKRFMIYFTYVLYCTISMVGGVRSTAVLNIAVTGFVYLFVIEHKKVKIRDVVILGCLGIIMLKALVAIRDIRSYGFSISAFVTAFFKADGFLLDYLNETTITSLVLVHVMEYAKGTELNFMGQFISSLFTIVPGISVISPVDLNQYSLQSLLNLQSLGGSYVSDFYFDKNLILGSLIWGMFIYKIFYQFERKNNILRCAFWSPILAQIMYSIRSSTGQFPRLIVWYTLFFMAANVLACFLRKKKRILYTKRK